MFKPLGELVDRLLEREDALDLAGRAERRARAGVGEDVVLFLAARSGTDTSWRARSRRRRRRRRRRCRSSRARSRSSVPSRFAPILSRCRLSGRLPADTCSSRRSSINRTGAPALRDRLIASRPKLPMPYFAPNPPPVKSLMTRTRFFGRSNSSAASSRTLDRELRRGIDGEHVVGPVGDESVRLHRHVRLHLGAVFGVDDDVGGREPFLDVAARQAERPPGVRAAHVPSLRQPGGAPPPPAVAGCSVGPGKTAGASALHRLVHVADVREHVVADLHERAPRRRRRAANRRDAGDRLTEIADHRIARLLQARDRGAARSAAGGPARAPHALRDTAPPATYRCRESAREERC